MLIVLQMANIVVDQFALLRQVAFPRAPLVELSAIANQFLGALLVTNAAISLIRLDRPDRAQSYPSDTFDTHHNARPQ